MHGLSAVVQLPALVHTGGETKKSEATRCSKAQNSLERLLSRQTLSIHSGKEPRNLSSALSPPHWPADEARLSPTYWTVTVWVVIRDVNCKLKHTVLIKSMPNEYYSKPHCKKKIKIVKSCVCVRGTKCAINVLEKE